MYVCMYECVYVYICIYKCAELSVFLWKPDGSLFSSMNYSSRRIICVQNTLYAINFCSIRFSYSNERIQLIRDARSTFLWIFCSYINVFLTVFCPCQAFLELERIFCGFLSYVSSFFYPFMWHMSVCMDVWSWKHKNLSSYCY